VKAMNQEMNVLGIQGSNVGGHFSMLMWSPAPTNIHERGKGLYAIHNGRLQLIHAKCVGLHYPSTSALLYEHHFTKG
jgi:hypothetical protein